MYERGQLGYYHHPGGFARATVLKPRGANCYDLTCSDVDFGETQMVPLHPGDDGRWFQPDDLPPAALEAPPETLPLGLQPRPVESRWPVIAALVVAGASLGWHVVNLLMGGP